LPANKQALLISMYVHIVEDVLTSCKVVDGDLGKEKEL
jgi:hypothetical protein